MADHARTDNVHRKDALCLDAMQDPEALPVRSMALRLLMWRH